MEANEGLFVGEDETDEIDFSELLLREFIDKLKALDLVFVLDSGAPLIAALLVKVLVVVCFVVALFVVNVVVFLRFCD